MSIDVFLSHNSKDKPAIRELKTELQRVGLSTWLDEDDLVAGQPWLDAIEVAIKSAKSIVVAIGSSGLGPWETPEMRSALIEMVRRNVPVIPLLLPGAPTQVELPLFLQTLTWIDCRTGFLPNSVERIKASVDGRPHPNNSAMKTVSLSKSDDSGPVGMRRFIQFANNFQSTIGLSAKLGLALPILPILIGLEPPWDGQNKIQEKCTIGLLTLVVQIIALTSVYVLLQKKSPAELRTSFKWSLAIAIAGFVGYLVTFVLLTELQPDTSNRLISGFLPSKYFESVLEENNGDMHQSKLDFGYDPLRIYKPWTVWSSMLLVLGCWLAFFGTFVFYLGSFVQTTAQEPSITDDRALVVLNLVVGVRNKLQQHGVETVGDVCALNQRQLRLYLDDSEEAYNCVIESLSLYGIALRSNT